MLRRLLTHVKHEMANGHKHDRGGRSRLLVDAVVNASGDDEKNGQNEKGIREPSLARDAIREKDEADATSNRGQGDCQ